MHIKLLIIHELALGAFDCLLIQRSDEQYYSPVITKCFSFSYLSKTSRSSVSITKYDTYDGKNRIFELDFFSLKYAATAILKTYFVVKYCFIDIWEIDQRHYVPTREWKGK